MGALAAIFADVVGRTGARLLAGVAGFVVLYGTLVIVANVAIGDIATAVPSYVHDAVAMFVPSLMPTFITTLLTVRIARWVYDVNVSMAKLVAH